jgi:glycosyltransferase involved in cell wall biosynthesis
MVESCSTLIVGINYVNRPLPTCEWLRESGKLKAVIFQNEEKRDEFNRDAKELLPDTKRVVLFGAVDLRPFLNLDLSTRDSEPLTILKHCMADTRKYVTTESRTRGEKKHVWQKHLDKELDTKLYTRLLRDVPAAQFEFMQAHRELEAHFSNEPRMRFYKWDEIPVTEFLSRGHVYLYRTSNAWRDQYPRVVAEALAAGLPVLSEPRDGTKDRIQHGDTGFHCVDYDGWCYGLKLLARKEAYRRDMGRHAREWAEHNLNPARWVEVIEEILSGNTAEK